MKRIAFLTERLKEGFGVDLVVIQQLRIFAQNKVKVKLLAIETDEKLVQSLGLLHEKLELPLSFNPLRQDFISLKYFLKHKNELLAYDTYVIHTPTFNSWIPLFRLYGKRVIVCYYGNSPSSSYRGLKKLRKPVFDVCEKFFYFNFAHKILPISNFLGKSLPFTLRSKVAVNYLSGEHILQSVNSLNPKQKQAILDQYFIESTDTIVCYIGRLDYRNNPYKGTLDLFKLIKALRKLPNRVKLFAIGFPENNVEQEMFDAGICVVPLASDDELAVILERSALYISPSRWEGFNLPLLEAQTLGKPAIVYDAGAHAEVLGREAGYLVQSYAEFEQKVLELLQNKLLNQSKSIAAKQHAKTFTWEKNMNELQKYL